MPQLCLKQRTVAGLLYMSNGPRKGLMFFRYGPGLLHEGKPVSLCPWHQVLEQDFEAGLPRSWGRKASDPLPVLGAENINLVNPIFKVTKSFNPTGKSNKN